MAAKRLRSIRTFALSEPSEAGPKSADWIKYQAVALLPDRFWWAYDAGPDNRSLKISNLQSRRLWTLEFGGPAGARTMRADEAHDKRQDLEELQLAYFLETSAVRPALRGMHQTGPRTAVIDASLEPEFPKLEYTIDLETRLPTGLILTFACECRPNSWTYRFEGTVQADGLTLPKRAEINRAWSTLTYVINPNLDPKMFDARPEDNSLDAWRKWLRR